MSKFNTNPPECIPPGPTNVTTKGTPSRTTILVKTWADWIREFEPFEWYSTHTFKDDQVHSEFASRQLKKWVRGINETLHGRRYREKGAGIYYFKATEYQRRGTIHFHLLLGGGLSKLLRMGFEERWMVQHPGNGFCRIYPYDPSKGAVYYLGKYVAKNGDIEPFFPPWLMDKINNNNLKFGFAEKVTPPPYELDAEVGPKG